MSSRKLPPLNWLRAFEASARHLSFTKAAQELNMTRAAISKQIRCLEYNLGADLFIRMPRKLELSVSGSAYLPSVRDSIERLSITTNELFGQRRSELLTICVNSAFFDSWLAPRLHDFRAQHPDVNIRFTSAIWMNEAEIDRSAHLEIRYGRGEWSNLKSDRLTCDELFPVCSPKLLKQAGDVSTVDDIARFTLLHVIGYEEGWGYWLNAVGCSTVDVDKGLYFDTSISAQKVASQGLGFSLGRTSLVESELSEGRLLAPFSEKVPTDEAFYLVYPVVPEPLTQEGIFRQWLIDQAGTTPRAAKV